MVELAAKRTEKKEGAEMRKRIKAIIKEKGNICGNDIAKILYLQNRNKPIDKDISLPDDCLQKDIANMRANVSYHLGKLQTEGTVGYDTIPSEGGIDKKMWFLK